MAIALLISASSTSIQRTANSATSFIQNMGINHGGFDILMAQEFLNGTDIVVILQKLGGKAMAKSMTTDSLVDTGQTSG